MNETTEFGRHIDPFGERSETYSLDFDAALRVLLEMRQRPVQVLVSSVDLVSTLIATFSGTLPMPVLEQDPPDEVYGFWFSPDETAGFRLDRDLFMGANGDAGALEVTAAKVVVSIHPVWCA